MLMVCYRLFHGFRSLAFWSGEAETVVLSATLELVGRHSDHAAHGARRLLLFLRQSKSQAFSDSRRGDSPWPPPRDQHGVDQVVLFLHLRGPLG